MATPSDQATIDAEQTEAIEAAQTDIALVAHYLRNSGNFIPESVAQMPGEKRKPPAPSAECQLYGSYGYRVFPYNGGWYSFRSPALATIRQALAKAHGVEENEFFMRMDDGKRVLVPYGEAQGEEASE